MKWIIYLGMALPFLWPGCGKEEAMDRSDTLLLNDTLELYVGQTLHNESESISLTFDSLLNDSRCPQGAVCIWEGNAEVQFRFTAVTTETQFSLHTHGSCKGDSLINAYRIKLVQVQPYPELDVIIVPESYRVKVIVSKR